MRNKEYSTKDIDGILSNKRTNKSVLANKKAVLAALTEDEKRVARAYMSEMQNDKREAIEYAKEAINNGTAQVYDGMGFVDVVEQWVDEGLFSNEQLMQYVDYKRLARDVAIDITVYEDEIGTVILNW